MKAAVAARASVMAPMLWPSTAPVVSSANMECGNGFMNHVKLINRCGCNNVGAAVFDCLNAKMHASQS